MSRDSGGTYTSPSGQFVAGTTILANTMNSKLNDLGEEITNSLDRNGKGGMLTYLRGVDGTINLPAYSFTAETTLGVRRAGTGDLRVSKDGSDILKCSTSEVRVYSAGVMEKGLTITQSTANTAGTTSTGNGTGAGVVATGGATGAGGAFTGGATSGAGITATAGANSANGGTFAGGTTSGYGIQVTAGSYGAHIRGGIGLDVLATGTVAINAVGAAGSDGILATGGAGAVGLKASAGTAATAADPTNAAELTNGNLKLSGTAPNANEALANTLTPINIPKALARISMAVANTPVLEWGFNIASVVMDGGVDDQIVVTFAQAFADADEVVITTGSQYAVATSAITTTSASFQLYAMGSASPVDLDTVTGIRLSITAYGRQ